MHSLRVLLFLSALGSSALGQTTIGGGPNGGGPTTGGPTTGGPTTGGPTTNIGSSDGGGTIARPGDGSTITIPGDGGVVISVPGDGTILPGGGPNVAEPTLIVPRGALLDATVTATVLLPRPLEGSTPPTYQWSVQGAQPGASTRNATFEFVANRVGKVTLSVSGTNNGESYSLTEEVTIISAVTAGKITAPPTVATNAATATASVPAAQSGDRTFRWSITGDAAITEGRETASVTFRPGSPGAKELTCAVNLQSLVNVVLRAIVVVTGDGPPVLVTVNHGSGGGTHTGGSRVDLFAHAPTATQVFDRWTGDTSVLGVSETTSVFSPHVVITVPARPITLTATYKTVPAWTPTTVAAFGDSGVALSYFIPASARGLVFLLHETGADAASWFGRPEPALLTRALVAAGYGVAALSSTDRSARTAWSTVAPPAANADLRNHVAALEKFTRENTLPAAQPVFFLGLGAGGTAAAQLAHLLATTTPARAPKGVVLFAASTTETLAVTAQLPHCFVLPASDEPAGGFALAETRNHLQLLTGRGLATDLVTTARAPVHAERFRALGATSPAFTANDAQAIWSALKNDDLLDANSYVRGTPDLDDVTAVLPAALRPHAADVLAQLTIARAGPALNSECAARVIAFLHARAAAEPGPEPGRLINLSTRTRIGFVGDTFTLGFTLTGSERATLLIRGIGPGLAGFGVDTALMAPRLEVHRGTTLIAANEGWEQGGNAAALDAAAARIGAFALKSGDLDTAALLTLEPGTHTVTLTGINGASGDALVEVYDVSRNATRLTNLSTLGRIHADGELLVPGIAIEGAHPRTLIARAVGPGLGALALDIASVLGDPRLSVLNSSGGTMRSNQNWSVGSGPALAAAFPIIGAFPLTANSADAGLVAALTPGSYTLQVGAGTSATPGQAATTASPTGLVLVELYEVP